MTRRAWEIVLPVSLVVLLAFVPKISADIPKLFNGPLNSPGTLQLLALVLLVRPSGLAGKWSVAH